jgi:hypothetical protein
MAALIDGVVVPAVTDTGSAESADVLSLYHWVRRFCPFPQFGEN